MALISLAAGCSWCKKCPGRDVDCRVDSYDNVPAAHVEGDGDDDDGHYDYAPAA
ncbi:methylthioadenosine nucleosidase 1 [Perilla frutescens var. hirtella]|nr:methylthioadenosine nucleosidase 1 [Perilla frutescens var. hirtella]